MAKLKWKSQEEADREIEEQRLKALEETEQELLANYILELDMRLIMLEFGL